MRGEASAAGARAEELQRAYGELEEALRVQKQARAREGEAWDRARAKTDAEWQRKLRALTEARDAALKAAMDAASAASGVDGAGLVEKLTAAQEQIGALRRELAAKSAAYGEARVAADAWEASAHRLQAELGAAVAERTTAAQERDELRARVAELEPRADAAEAAAAERDAAREQCAQLEARGGVLDEQVESLERQLHAATTASAASERRAVEVGKALQNSKGLSARLGAELHEAKGALEGALSSVGTLQGDKTRLTERVEELVARYRAAASALARTGKELQMASRAIQQGSDEYERMSAQKDSEMRGLQESSHRERSLLVRAALQSLTQLRAHLTATLSGLHVAPAEESEAAEAASWHQWRSRWGVVAPNNEPALVRLMPPDTPPLTVKQLATSPRAGLASRPSAANASLPPGRQARHAGGALVPPPHGATVAAGSASPSVSTVNVEAPHFFTNARVQYRPSSAVAGLGSRQRDPPPLAAPRPPHGLRRPSHPSGRRARVRAHGASIYVTKCGLSCNMCPRERL